MFPSLFCFLTEIQVFRIVRFNTKLKSDVTMCTSLSLFFLCHFRLFFEKGNSSFWQFVFGNIKELQEILKDIGWVSQLADED